MTFTRSLLSSDTDGGGYGQNIAAGSPGREIASVITDLFYNSEMSNFDGLYGQATPGNMNDETAFHGWGHFTQIVWINTNSVGCATVDCSASGLANTANSVPPYFTVCNYRPAGMSIDQMLALLIGHHRQLSRRVQFQRAGASQTTFDIR